MIEYRKGDLFSAPKGVVLAHACNAQGVWGSGVAKAFKEKFPYAFDLYNDYCLTDYSNMTMSHWTSLEGRTIDRTKKKETKKSVGKCFLVHDQDYRIACLITSDRYGKDVDNPAQILQATESSFKQLIGMLKDEDEVHMPKINSGLFRTPWDETEKCIESILSNSDKKIKCVVWELE